MAEENTKTGSSTSVRIYRETKKRLKNVVREMSAKEQRDVTELELVDGFCRRGLPKLERKLGIK